MNTLRRRRRPHQGSARSSLARVFAGTSRVSTSAPELVIVDFVAEHAQQPQDEFAGHGDDSDGRIFSSFEARVEAAEVFKQEQRVVALNGEGAGKRKSGELPLAADGEEFWAQTQAMAERSMPASGRQVCATGW